MALSAAITEPIRAVPARFAAGALAIGAAVGGSEAVYRLAGPLWGAACFAAVFTAILQAGVIAGMREGPHGRRAALFAVASLVPLARLLVLSTPAVPFLRIDPGALWALPLTLVSVYAYRASWISGSRPSLRIPAGGEWAPTAAVVAAGACLGPLAAWTAHYSGAQVLIHPDAAKWAAAVLFAVAGGGGELAWRGVLQPQLETVAGPAGAAVCFAASAYTAVAWMGWGAAAPVIALSALTTVVVYRTHRLTGAVAAHTLLNLLLVVLR